tara:strand:+ start:276 stop:650 length:375 start_codon:yes stop_codon:yes gene_type:complete
MAEEIIDLRDRIEKMRIQIENEAVEQISADSSLEVYKKSSDSNISLSMQNKKSFPNQKYEAVNNSKNLNKIYENNDKTIIKNETFPAVSLSVKNPVSSKILIALVTLQILSNIGILYFLYIGME